MGNGTGVGNGVVGDGGYGGRAGLPGAGVLGRNILIAARDAGDLGGVSNQPLGVGVKGEGTLSGVEGHAMGEGFDYAFNESGVAAAGGVGVLGRDINVNRGVGVQGESPNLGVKGTSPRVGVSGEGPSDGSITHIAVRGLSPNGLGGVFGGGRAQLKLNPNATTGRPTTGTHQTGELFMNSTCELFICSRSGSPGTWRKVQTVPA